MFLSFWHAGIDFETRKIASMSKPQKVIKQNGDCFTIRTITTFKSYECSFRIGEEFKEVTGMDNRSCRVKTLSKCNIIVTKLYANVSVITTVQYKKNKSCFRQSHTANCFSGCIFVLYQTVVNWENDKLCVQKGEKKNRGWTHWIQGDELHLVCDCTFLCWWPCLWLTTPHLSYLIFFIFYYFTINFYSCMLESFTTLCFLSSGTYVWGSSLQANF